ncbi:molybdopterin-synthase adenylyltransferase MoeB [Maritalea mediterranea]|uniref:Molybdopterin-synthase adenylyltransferase MoeB n=1 Tax=Maritalea mediterranea TaxID=2909667 RepID=A0ABS9E6G5_9HYPH|nr:molybdopterin-synthase adenylyltransferase MoeB [Maritalea mediterranea]MCF4097023.1 molybdopterin-synthase adenylyltransferase MoeB [Maritalea mediterranea]
MSLSAEETARYARHIVLKRIGGVGQQRLKAAKVLIIGAGGLGSPALAYLAAAGVGTIGIIDDDHVSLSNLQRQIVHRTSDEGVPKVDSAQRFASELNPHVTLIPHHLRLLAENGDDLISAYDLVLDGSDNFATRKLVADLCAAHQKPLVAGAVTLFDGNLTVFMPFEGENPSFDDLYPAPPENEAQFSCEEVGILGPITGVIGSLQALEAIKLIAGVGQPLVGEMLIYDSLNATTRKMKYRRRAKA